MSLRNDVQLLKIYLTIYAKVNIHLPPTVLNTKLQFSAKSKTYHIRHGLLSRFVAKVRRSPRLVYHRLWLVNGEMQKISHLVFPLSLRSKVSGRLEVIWFHSQSAGCCNKPAAWAKLQELNLVWRGFMRDHYNHEIWIELGFMGKHLADNKLIINYECL